MQKEETNGIVKLLELLSEENNITVKNVLTNEHEVHVILMDSFSNLEYYLTIEPRGLVA